MARPGWLRVSLDAISMVGRVRRSGRQDLVAAVERHEMPIEAALQQIDGNSPLDQPTNDEGLTTLADGIETLVAEAREVDVDDRTIARLLTEAADGLR